MTVQLVEGFDLYNGIGANTGLQGKWTLNGVTTGMSMVTGRFGGQGFQCSSAAGATRLMGRTFPADASFAFGMAIEVTALNANSANAYFLEFWSGSTPMVALSLDTTNHIAASRITGASAGTVLGTTTNAVLINTWYYLEVEIVISDTVGVFNVYLNGTQVLNLTNVDTRNGTPTTCDTIYCGVASPGSTSGTPPTIIFDDMYEDDSGTKLGERRVETLYPTADTAQKDFTPNSGVTNYTQVNELHCDGDTTYVQGSSVGNTDRYTFGSLTGSPATIDAVQVSSFAEKTDATSRSIALQVKSGATTSDGSNFSLGTSYSKLERLMTTDPNGGGAWTASAVNALLAGPKVTV